MNVMYRNKTNGVKFLLLLLFATIGVMLLIFRVEHNAIEKSIQETTKADMRTFNIDMDNKIAFITSDVLLLEDIIINRNVLSLDSGSTVFLDEELKTNLEHDIIDWLKNRSIYDQIRIIDMNGDEILRADWNDGYPSLVAENELQNKADRYYFTNAIDLEDNVLYMSKMDLNVENGEIEYIDGEAKQMIRFGSTIFDDDGNQLGLILVNYFSKHLFHDKETSNSRYTFFEVINNDGYFLHAEDESIEYGFMYEDMEDEVFEKYHDYNIFENANDSITQDVYEGDTYTSLFIDNHNLSDAITNILDEEVVVYSDNGDIYIFGEVDIKETEQYLLVRNAFIGISIVLVFLSLIISRLIDEVLHFKKERVRILEFTSNHDLLTGLPNRAKIFKTIEYLNTRNVIFTILFLDLNKFKQVNDVYGHNIGDEVLIESSKRLQASVRETDTVARLGGDEFLILLQDLVDVGNIDRICSKIKLTIEEKFIFDTVTCSVGVSIGVAIQDGTKTTEEMVHQADQEMYADKNANR